MIDEQFTDTALRATFANAQLDNFEALWSLQLPWFEEPNHRRNGWSGVVTHSLQQADETDLNLFIKRQQNHNTPTLWSPIKGEPTFRREFRNIIRLQQCNIPAVEAIYYGERKTGKDYQAILITRALDGYLPIPDFYPSCEENPSALIQAIAELAVKLHKQGLAHYCFYPGHIFAARDTEGNINLRLIDLEKLRYHPSPSRRIIKDFCTFIRRARFMGKARLIELLDSYTKINSHMKTNDKTYQQLINMIEKQDYS